MESMGETVANWAASESGSEMLNGVATTALGILIATFILEKICPLAILLAKLVLKLCALARLATKLVLQRIFQRPAPVRAAATTGAENGVELHERDGGTAPGRAQGVDV